MWRVENHILIVLLIQRLRFFATLGKQTLTKSESTIAAIEFNPDDTELYNKIVQNLRRRIQQGFLEITGIQSSDI